MRLRNRRGWIRWLGLAAVPLVVVSSFLGLLLGVTGLCVGIDDMVRPGHADHAMALCLFFCGATLAPAMLLVFLWIVLATLFERAESPPLLPLGPIFHPPVALPA